MKIHFSYIIFLFVAIFVGNDVMAQDKNSDKSEIVMTQSQLDSLLGKIARIKKEQLAKRRDGQMRTAQVEDQYADTDSKKPKEEVRERRNDDRNYDDRLSREFDRLNRRIDFIVMNMNSGGGTSGGGQVIYPNGSNRDQARMTYNITPNQGQAPNPAMLMDNQAEQQPQQQKSTKGDNSDDKKDVNAERRFLGGDSGDTLAKQSNKLQSQINELNEKLRVLDTLKSITKSSDYEGEIGELRNRIDSLKKDKEDLANKDVELKGYEHAVYFANNSTKVEASDKDALADLVELVERSDANVLVMLHGFASKTGSAQYNNTISFERADAVKQILLDGGLKTKNIVTTPHGVDREDDPAKARRVEISLRVQ